MQKITLRKEAAVMKDTKKKSVAIALESVRTRLARWTEQGELHTTAIPGLSLFRREEPTEPISGMYEPSICMVAQGAHLRQIASAGTQSHQIARAIDWLQSNYSRSLRIDDLAAQVSISLSTFHHHFRAMTSLSP
jgi:hypothetical protein